MKCFDQTITEDELKKIIQKDNLFTEDVISLNDNKNKKALDNYAYQQYLKKEVTNNLKDGTNANE